MMKGTAGGRPCGWRVGRDENDGRPPAERDRETYFFFVSCAIWLLTCTIMCVPM